MVAQPEQNGFQLPSEALWLGALHADGPLDTNMSAQHASGQVLHRVPALTAAYIVPAAGDDEPMAADAPETLVQQFANVTAELVDTMAASDAQDPSNSSIKGCLSAFSDICLQHAGELR